MNKEVKIGNRIKECREKAGLTQEELGFSLGLNKSTIQRYEAGKISRIKLPVLEAIANELNVNPEYLALKTDDPIIYEETEENLNAPLAVIEHFNGDAKKIYNFKKAVDSDAEREALVRSNVEILPDNNVYMIPVFESVSAGFGAYACSDVVDYIPLYIKNPADVDDTLCIKVKGDSMFPKIEDGDMIIVRKQSSIYSGQIAVILIDGEEGVVKKVSYGDDWIELISINPMYPPRRFEGAEVQRLSVVGLVQQVIKNV